MKKPLFLSLLLILLTLCQGMRAFSATESGKRKAPSGTVRHPPSEDKVAAADEGPAVYNEQAISTAEIKPIPHHSVAPEPAKAHAAKRADKTHSGTFWALCMLLCLILAPAALLGGLFLIGYGAVEGAIIFILLGLVSILLALILAVCFVGFLSMLMGSQTRLPPIDYQSD